MEIKTKFDVGDTVYPIMDKYNQTRTKCPVCDGTGEIKYKDKKYICPNIECSNGTIFKSEKITYEVGCPFKIKRIEISKKQNEIEISYFETETSHLIYRENKLMPSLKDAENRCNELNIKGEYDEGYFKMRKEI